MLPIACQGAGTSVVGMCKDPLSTRRISAWRREVSFTKKAGSVPPKSGRTLPPEPDVSQSGQTELWYDSRNYAAAMAEVWQRRFGCPKEAAQQLRQTPRAARNQFEADSGPAGYTLCNAMAHNAEVLADVLRMVGHGDLAALVEDKAAREAALQSIQRTAAILRGEDVA